MTETQNVADRLREKLHNALTPTHLEILDESHLHAGHAGAREGGQSHFRLLIVSPRFEGLSRIARQRLVNDTLRDELKEQVHALAMKTLTPQQFAEDTPS